MHVRLTYLAVPKQSKEEMKKAYYSEIAPVIREQIGIIDVLLLEPANAEDEFISCSMWKSEEDRIKFESTGIYQKVFAKVRKFVTGAPQQKYYTVSQN